MKINNITEGHWEIAPENYPGSILPKERKAKRHGILAYPEDRKRFMKNMGLAEEINDIKYNGETTEHKLEDCKTKDFDEAKWKKIELADPPANDSKQTQLELNQIITLTSNITDEERQEIQLQDKDDIEDLFFDILDDHDVKYKKNLHDFITNLTEQMVTICLHFKSKYNRARPKQLLSQQDAKLIKGGKTAKSASYPSAHAVIGKALSGIFSKLYPQLSYEFDKLGTSLGYNRVKAGYHFKSDYEAGIKLANALLKDNLNTIVQKIDSPAQISEAVVGKSKEELDLVARIIWNVARKHRGKPNAIINFEREVNQALLPYRIKFDENNPDLRRMRMPAKVERVDDGVIAVIHTPPIGSLMNNMQHIMMLISHELVHVDQLNRAEARKPGSIDIMYRNYDKRVMKNGRIDRDAYASDRHELMAYARSTVDALKQQGFSKDEIIDLLRRGQNVDIVGPKTVNQLDKRRKQKYAIAYAQQLEESVKNQSILKDTPTNKLVKWVMPDIQREIDELQRTADTFKIDLNNLIQATKKSRLVPLDEITWRSMKNTDSYEIKKGDMKTVNSLGGGYGRDVGKILEAFRQGGSLPAPIVLVRNNEPYLVGGNTRLMVSRAMGVQPMILKVVLN